MKTSSKILAASTVIVLSLGGIASAQNAERGGELFERLDTNGDGEVSKAEAEAAHASRFADADTNGDGQLSADELQAGAEQRRADRFARMIERHDTDSNGLLSPEEMGEGRGAGMFERLDKNGDGVITEEEAAEAKGRHGGRRDRNHDRRG